MGLKDRNGWNVMHQICSLIFWGEQGRVLRELARGIGVDALNAKTTEKPRGKTPLMLLCAGCNTSFDTAELVQVLIDAKADMELECPKGQTALSFAAASGMGDVVKVLIDNGANVSHINRLGKTVADLLGDAGNDHGTLRLLAEKGVGTSSSSTRFATKRSTSNVAPSRVVRSLRTLDTTGCQFGRRRGGASGYYGDQPLGRQEWQC